MNRFREDDYGQVDGDASVQFQALPSDAIQPWLREQQPPWHMWGNTQQISAVIETTGALRVGTTNQLVRISYKRPETWHWIFSARLLSGPANTAGFFTRLFVHWELTSGIGRSAIQMAFPNVATTFAQPAFDDFTFQWGPVNPAFPVGAQIWATEATTPGKSFQADGPASFGNPLQQIVAQDLQLQVQIVGLTVPANVAAVGQTAVVEVSAQFAPKTHVRPDWFIPKPAEMKFPGAEIQGR